jgi:predicted TIM-barrel fold metal-dependent hydrolase
LDHQGNQWSGGAEVIIDTETHIMQFARPARLNPHMSLVKHYTWHEHTGELLIAEMDEAGVDQAFLISYDAEDIWWGLKQRGFSIEDFAGGRKYTLLGVQAFPDRLLWFSTMKDPRKHNVPAQIEQDKRDGAVGVKLFPGFLQLSLLDPALISSLKVAHDHGLRLLISFEVLRPPATLSLVDYLHELRSLMKQVPDLPICLLHAGCADPLTNAIEPVVELVQEFPQLYLSTAYPGEVWDDGTEYPFANYLRRMERLVHLVGADRLMWGTDWPWFEDRFKYQQAVNAIRLHAPFFDQAGRDAFLGKTALKFLGRESSN